MEILVHNSINFVNGLAMNITNPDTFSVPSLDEKLAVKPGGHIKIGVKVNSHNINCERFWGRVVQNDTDNHIITVMIDNDLICTDIHGLRYDDCIQVPYDVVLDVI